MTRKEAWERIDIIITRHEVDDIYVTITKSKDYDALRTAREVLEQAPCDDAISRQELINWIESIQPMDGKELGVLFDVREHVKKLPSVVPTQKMGRWEQVSPHNFKCSNCGEFCNNGYLLKECPNCRAKMKGAE